MAGVHKEVKARLKASRSSEPVSLFSLVLDACSSVSGPADIFFVRCQCELAQ